MSPSRNVAILGASRNRGKFGNKALRAFLSQGWRVFPVNPNEATVEGIAAYPDLDAIAESLDTVALYVPPNVGLELLPQIAAKAPKTVIVNPGAGSPELDAAAQAAGLILTYDCAIRALGLDPGDFPDD